jgi:hypothetical protein
MQLVADLHGRVAGDLEIGPGFLERLMGRREDVVVGVPVGRGEPTSGP